MKGDKEKSTTKVYLSKEQVREMNKKHGWFHYGDAQGDVSEAFANEAIERYERICAAAPDMLAVLKEISNGTVDDSPDLWGRVSSAIDKAEGRQVIK